MRMEVERYRILIIPDSEVDIAYIEEVLGMKEESDSCLCWRVDGMGVSSIAYVEIKNRRVKEI